VLYRAEGIVLRTYPFGEADRVVVLFTAERGKVRAVAKGVSRARSRLAAAVQPFTHARYLLWQGRELDGISQAELVRGSHALTGALGAVTAAAYAAELVDACWEDRQEAPEAFALLRDGLDWLVAGPEATRPSFLRWFELQVLARGGFHPELEACAHCGRPLAAAGRLRYVPERGGLCCDGCGTGGTALGPAARAWLRDLAACDLDRLPPPPDGPAAREVAAALHGHLTFIVGRPLRSRALLELGEDG
jgi:DNA repair protein RecO (recombination protein O)